MSFASHKATALFVLAVLALAWAYDYPRITNLGPVSYHYWRQSDGASLARSYYENGMRFLNPKVHHMAGGDNCAVSEFPVLYYTVAALFHLFGPHHSVFRVFNFLVLALGLYCLFRLLLRRLGDIWLALFPPLLLLSSPLLAFYGPGFLPNTTALGLILVAAWLFFKYEETRRPGWFFAAAGTGLLAGLLKISLLIPLLALAGAIVLSRLIRRTAPEQDHMPRLSYLAGAILAILGSAALWYSWARQYNVSHQAGYFFLIDIKPIWKMDENYLRWTTEELLYRQRFLYFNTAALLALVMMTLTLLAFPRRLPPVLYLTLWLALIGSGTFVLLFYNQLAVHHYYIIDLMPLPALATAAFLWFLRTHWPPITQTWALRFMLFLLLAGNIRATRAQLAEYFKPDSNYIMPEFTSLNKEKELEGFLRARGIRYPESAVVIGDVSPNAALYYLNLRGWNLTGPADDVRIRQFIQWGASYLVVLDPNYLRQYPLPEMTSKPIGVFDGRIAFYDLKGLK